MESVIKATEGWQDITNQCTLYGSPVTTGNYASKVLYNPSTKMIVGNIDIEAEISNQHPILSYPSTIGLPVFTGICGIGHHKDATFTIDVRCADVSRALYSSHSVAKVAPIGTQYEFCVCVK